METDKKTFRRKAATAERTADNSNLAKRDIGVEDVICDGGYA